MSNDYIDSYQRWQQETVWPSVHGDSGWAMTALTSEVGELAQMYEKTIRKGNTYTKDEINSEVGDILWNVSNILALHDITLSECMEYNINKIERRREERHGR